MAIDYALVHLKFTIPPAVLLTLVAYPMLHRAPVYKTALLVFISFFAILPLACFFIESGIWSYPSEAILGWKYLGVPVEELFFILIQTYITSLTYILCNAPILHAGYLEAQCKPTPWITWAGHAGQTVLFNLTVLGIFLVQYGKECTYLGLVFAWAGPFALLNWSIAGRFILSLPRFSTLLPIVISSAYFWLIDSLVLQRGACAVEDGIKFGVSLFGSFDLEDALFFLTIAALTVSGLAAADQALAIIDISPNLFPSVPRWPSLHMILKACVTRPWDLDLQRIQAIRDADERLTLKSRSFHRASFAFTGRFRIDLILLYSFCRMADDLIDEAESEAEILFWTRNLIRYLDCFYIRKGAGEYVHHKKVKQSKVQKIIETQFPISAWSALRFLPTEILPGNALYGLIEGFKMDSQFELSQDADSKFPIKNEMALRTYCYYVAGTIGELCVALVAHHCQFNPNKQQLAELDKSAAGMGIALQLTNIARDIATDADIGRVYLPTSWLEEKNLAPEDVVKNPSTEPVHDLRMRLLDVAEHLSRMTRPCMNQLPSEVRGPMILVAENYVDMGGVMREMDISSFSVRGKVPVSKARVLKLAMKIFFGA